MVEKKRRPLSGGQPLANDRRKGAPEENANSRNWRKKGISEWIRGEVETLDEQENCSDNGRHPGRRLPDRGAWR